MFRPKKLSFQLSELASQFGGKVVGEAKITGVSLNTSRLEKGDLFMALPARFITEQILLKTPSPLVLRRL